MSDLDRTLKAIADLCPENIPEIECLPISGLSIGDQCLLVWSGDMGFWRVKGFCDNDGVDVVNDKFDAHMEVPRNELRLASDLLNARQSEIDQLKAQLNNMEQCYIEKKKQVEEQRDMITELEGSLSTQKIEHYEMYGRINYAHHCFTSMSRNHFYKIIEEVIRGRLRHPDFSFDRTRIKALRGES